MKNNTRTLRPKIEYTQLFDHSRIKENLERRQLAVNLNLEDLCADLKSLKKVRKTRKNTLDRLRHWENKIGTESSATTRCEQKLSEYQQRLQKAQDDLDTGENQIADIEDRLSLACLSLPNDIAMLTPAEDRVQLTYGQKIDANQGRSHLDYANAIDFRNNGMVYLLGDAAKFDLQFPLQCVDYLCQNDFMTIRGPDFAKTALIEAAAKPLDGAFEIDEQIHDDCKNRLHLVGCGSIISHLGLLAKHGIAATSLPMRLVTSGRVYKQSESIESSLYNAVQSTEISVLIAQSRKHVDTELHDTIELITAIYKSLDLHFRIVNLSAPQLYPAECFAIRFEVYSPHRKRYIETGRLSHFGNFLSSRLAFQLERANVKDHAILPHMIGGNILNVTNVIAIMLETYDGSIDNNIKLQ